LGGAAPVAPGSGPPALDLALAHVLGRVEGLAGLLTEATGGLLGRALRLAEGLLGGLLGLKALLLAALVALLQLLTGLLALALALQIGEALPPRGGLGFVHHVG